MKHKLLTDFLGTASRPLALVATAALVAGCAQTPSSSGSSGAGMPSGGGMPGAGMPSGGAPGAGMPSGGTPGAGMPSGGAPGAGMPSGGGMPGGGMPDGGASGSSGSSGDSDGGGAGGSSGGGSGDSGGGGVGGVESIAGVPMPGGVGEFPGEGSGSGDAEALEKELDKSIGDFDEVLMEEQEQVQSVGRNTEGFDGTGGRGSGAGISLGEQAEGGMGSGGGSGGAPIAGQEQPKPVASTMSEEEIAARTPDDIEVIIDSDIVAKQLREAALAEDDPELRERLWEEYRKYNGLD